MEGFITIHRQLENKGYYKNSQYVHLWLHLLFKANYKKKEVLWNNRIIKLNKGQFITGRDILSQETGIPYWTIERILMCFEKEHQIIQQKTTKFRLITLVNYSKYQDKSTTKVQQKYTTNNDNNDNNKKEGFSKTKNPDIKNNMINPNDDGWDDPGQIIDEDQIPIIKIKQKNRIDPIRIDAENFLKYYYFKYKQEIGNDIPYCPKGKYLTLVNSVLTRISLEKLKILLGIYFKRDDKITRGNKWSISCFLSAGILIQLNE